MDNRKQNRKDVLNKLINKRNSIVLEMRSTKSTVNYYYSKILRIKKEMYKNYENGNGLRNQFIIKNEYNPIKEIVHLIEKRRNYLKNLYKGIQSSIDTFEF